MNYLPWKADGKEVSQIALGTMLMGSIMNREDSFRALDHFTEIGGNFIDTANCYAWWVGDGRFVGNESELLVGEWLKERGNRNDIVLCSKVGARIDTGKVIRNSDGTVDWGRYNAWNDYEGLKKETILSAVEGSLKRLKTDYLDLCLAHIDDSSVPLEETLEAFDLLVRQGKIRSIGGSNMESWRFTEARLVSRHNGWTPYSAIQTEHAYLRPRHGSDFGRFPHTGRDLQNYLAAHPEVLHMAYSPLLKGILADGKKRESIYLWPQFDSEDSRLRLATLDRIAGEIGRPRSQVALAWMLAQKAPRSVPVLGFSRFEQYEDNIKCLEFTLTEDQLAQLDKAGQ